MTTFMNVAKFFFAPQKGLHATTLEGSHIREASQKLRERDFVAGFIQRIYQLPHLQCMNVLPSSP